MNRVARLCAAALFALGLLAPSAAVAAPRHRARSQHAGPSYPMPAEEFRELMDKRIDRVRAAIDKKLDRRGVSAERKKVIHQIFDEASKDLRAEIAHATADGTVNEAEADKVKALAAGLRTKVRERLRAEKDPALKQKLAKEEAARAKKAKTDLYYASSEHAADKVAKAEPRKPSSGNTKATKAKSATKKPGPTKTAKARASAKQPEVPPGADL
jgi:hypothetical protein